MDIKNTALILIGYQNDYFSEAGKLRGAIEDLSRADQVLLNSLTLVDRFNQAGGLILATPIIFTPDYSELIEPIGILKLIRELGAFREGQSGSQTIPELLSYQNIVSIPGKRGLNAFSNTRLELTLRQHKINHVLIAGAITSLCIDTAGREAIDLGFDVTVLADCTLSRTAFEQSFYCSEIIPLYARVNDSRNVLADMDI